VVGFLFQQPDAFKARMANLDWRVLVEGFVSRKRCVSRKAVVVGLRLGLGSARLVPVDMGRGRVSVRLRISVPVLWVL